MVLGPWLHGGPKENKVGELEFPAVANFPYGGFKAHMSDYFRRHLKTGEGDSQAEPRVTYYVMGAVGEPDAPGHEWRGAEDWPIPAKPTAYYLSAGGALELQCSDEATKVGIVADPEQRADNGTGSVAFPGML